MNILASITEVELSIRCINTLRANKIESIIDVLKLSNEQILSLRNIVPRTVCEISKFQNELLTKDGVRYTISNDTPKNDDMVLTYNYGIWRYKERSSPLPFWTNANACVKLIY